MPGVGAEHSAGHWTREGLALDTGVAQNAVPSLGVTQLLPPGNVPGTGWGDN